MALQAHIAHGHRANVAVDLLAVLGDDLAGFQVSIFSPLAARMLKSGCWRTSHTSGVPRSVAGAQAHAAHVPAGLGGLLLQEQQGLSLQTGMA